MTRPAPASHGFGSAQRAFHEFITVHWWKVERRAAAMCADSPATPAELEQAARLALWLLDPSRYADADAPYVLRCLRSAMRNELRAVRRAACMPRRSRLDPVVAEDRFTSGYLQRALDEPVEQRSWDAWQEWREAQ